MALNNLTGAITAAQINNLSTAINTERTRRGNVGTAPSKTIATAGSQITASIANALANPLKVINSYGAVLEATTGDLLSGEDKKEMVTFRYPSSYVAMPYSDILYFQTTKTGSRTDRYTIFLPDGSGRWYVDYLQTAGSSRATIRYTESAVQGDGKTTYKYNTPSPYVYKGFTARFTACAIDCKGADYYSIAKEYIEIDIQVPSDVQYCLRIYDKEVGGNIFRRYDVMQDLYSKVDKGVFEGNSTRKSQTTGCNESCTGLCHTSCGTGCTGSCSGDCYTTCTGGCKGGCSGGCYGSCDDGCTDGFMAVCPDYSS